MIKCFSLSMLLITLLSFPFTTWANPAPLFNTTDLLRVQKIHDLANGTIAIPDALINNSLAHYVTGQSAVSDITYTAKDNNRFELVVKPANGKQVRIEATMEEFVHNKNQSFLKLKIHKKTLAEKSLNSWLFSHLSLGFLTKLFGTIDTPEGMDVSFKGNSVTIDFHDLIAANKTELDDLPGIPLADILRIHGASHSTGFLHIRTSLDSAATTSLLLQHILH